ncbi:MAG: M36 family metallopeptidase [Blastocatellia bacterium]|nr:M36 family metallopeptidase [Blastocatellia bacterium]
MMFRRPAGIRSLLGALAIVAVLLASVSSPSSKLLATPVSSDSDARIIRYSRHIPDQRTSTVTYGHLGRIEPQSDTSKYYRSLKEMVAEPADVLAFLESRPELTGSIEVAQALVLQRTVTSRLGSHVRFEQRIGERRVFGAMVTVHVNGSGDVFGMTSSLAGPIDKSLGTVGPSLDAGTAWLAAMDATNVGAERIRDDSVIEPELGVTPFDGGRLAWRVVVPARNPYGEWEVLVDALTGRVLGEPEPLFATAPQARVFVPNAVVATNNVSLTDGGNSGAAVPESAYTLVELQGLDNSGFLNGPFVSTDRTDNRVNSANGDFTALRRDDSGFAEVEVYWAIDYAQRYIQNTLGIFSAANYVIKADCHAFSDDNSNYTRTSSNTGVLNFGDGGVDDAQDAEIIWHEYGHAILDNSGPISFGGEPGAIHEGWGDYVAATLSTTVPGDSRFHPAIGEWDAVSYNPGNPPFLRRVDTNKQYPRDLVRQVHTDGEIYSSCLWDIHESVGRDVANRIVFSANFLLPSTPTMPDAAAAILEADRQLNGGANAAAIAAAFGGHGIVLDGVPPAVTFVKRKKGKLTVDGSNFTTGSAVIEIDGVALGSTKYPAAFRQDGLSTRMTSKDNRVAGLTPGIAVAVTVLNPSTGLRSAPFSFVP